MKRGEGLNYRVFYIIGLSFFAILLVLIFAEIGAGGYTPVKQTSNPITSIITKKLIFHENFNQLCDVYTNPPEIRTSGRGSYAEFDSYGEGCHYAPHLGGLNEWTVELWYYRKGTSNDTRNESEMFRTPFIRLSDNYINTRALTLSVRRCHAPEKEGLPRIAHSTREIKNNTWSYAVVTCQDNWINLYDNGIEMDRINLSSLTPICDCSYYEFNRLSIGLDFRDNVSYAWNGSLDEVKVWNKVLTKYKIRDNWEIDYISNLIGLAQNKLQKR